MIPRLRLSDLYNLSESERDKKIQDFLNAPKPTKEEAIQFLDEKIFLLEKKHNLTSQEMQKDFNLGKIQETHDICKWLIWLHARKKLDE
ncbi:MAG: hypothetical protein DWQ19_09050 [Crenarchaeota archaeon]|nr:MAG: hypothetical protein DWQ19_09050 [Thermoproteota archaeon]